MLLRPAKLEDSKLNETGVLVTGNTTLNNFVTHESLLIFKFLTNSDDINVVNFIYSDVFTKQ